jgi:hypothetical protein
MKRRKTAFCQSKICAAYLVSKSRSFREQLVCECVSRPRGLLSARLPNTGEGGGGRGVRAAPPRSAVSAVAGRGGGTGRGEGQGEGEEEGEGGEREREREKDTLPRNGTAHRKRVAARARHAGTHVSPCPVMDTSGAPHAPWHAGSSRRVLPFAAMPTASGTRFPERCVVKRC